MGKPDFSDAVWQKSNTSNESGCVEVAKTAEYVGLRDSKDRGGPVLVFTHHEWSAFLDGVRASQFDL